MREHGGSFQELMGQAWKGCTLPLPETHWLEPGHGAPLSYTKAGECDFSVSPRGR